MSLYSQLQAGTDLITTCYPTDQLMHGVSDRFVRQPLAQAAVLPPVLPWELGGAKQNFRFEVRARRHSSGFAKAQRIDLTPAADRTVSPWVKQWGRGRITLPDDAGRQP
jgi:hypothetical protein